jgi:hypothetical protein
MIVLPCLVSARPASASSIIDIGFTPSFAGPSSYGSGYVPLTVRIFRGPLILSFVNLARYSAPLGDTPARGPWRNAHLVLLI